MTHLGAREASVWLRAARVALVVLVALTLLGALASLALAPVYVPSHVDDFELSAGWTPALIQEALGQLGWPDTAIAWFEYGRSVFLYLGTLLPGLLVLRRRSNDWFGLYVAFTFTVVPAVVVFQPLVPWVPGLPTLIDLAGATAWQFYFILFYVFPNGRFVPRWTRWLLPVWVGLNLLPATADSPVVVVVSLALVFIAVGSQIYRYFWRADATQRQQTKLVVLALAAVAAAIGWLGLAFQSPTPGSPRLGAQMLLELGRLATVNVGFTLVPVAIVIAILRYRLFDVDVIIRRTLVYTTITGVLALVYFGSIVVLQGVFQAVTGEGNNALVTVLSTLLIAALFGTVRARVQRTIDRRFYRQKYDAARTLAAFGARARDVVALEQLTTELTKAVDETMQPAHVGLWLRPSAAPLPKEPAP